MASEFFGLIEGAFITVFTPRNFFLILLAVVFGMLMGVFPGLSGHTALALLIPLTFGMEPVAAFMILTAALSGTNYGGSITAILINTPGSGPNAATILDGYPMTQNGEGARALSISAVASACGALVGVVILILSVPVLMEVLLLFGAPEIFWLGVWGLTIIAVVVRGAVITGLISACLGLLIAMHGTSTITAGDRWTYDFTFLIDGIPLIPALIGLFAIGEMLHQSTKGGSISDSELNIGKGRLQGIKDVIKHKGLFLRSAIVGTVIGVVPGVGGSAANFIAYFQARQTSSNPEKYGTGDVRGVIAPEASNDAKDGTAFLPTLGFGIPGSASMAVLLGAFILHGIIPGPLLFQNHMDIVAIIILTLIVGNILTSAIGLIFAPYLALFTRVDIYYLTPLIFSISLFAAFAIDNNIYHMYIAFLFGILGLIMISIDMSRVPLLLGMILGSIVENNFFRSLLIGDHQIGVFVRSPIAIILIVLVVVSLFLPQIRIVANSVLMGEKK